MQQLSSVDSVFLSMETPETPGHIGGITILNPSTHPDDAFEFDRFVEFVAERLALCPRFSWRLQQVPLGLDRPYWVETPELDLRQHIHRMAVPSPGGQRELADLAGLLFPQPLDRSRPLWEMRFIEGLQGGRVALLWKVHHCLIDGGSGAGLAELMFDIEPRPGARPLVPVDDDARAGGRASLTDMLGSALRNSVELPVAGVRHIGSAVLGALEELFDPDDDDTPATAPRASFNGSVGSQRALAWSTVSLEDVKTMKEALGVKLNDVVLAITGGAVRYYLDERGELPEQSLVAAVPVSTRDRDDKTLGNQITEVNVYWGTDVEDPVERTYAIHEAANAAKQSVRKGRNIDPVTLFAETLMPGAVTLFMRGAAAAADSMPLPANAVVSNVPMTPVPLYIAGARVADVVPISLLAPTQGLNITVIGYDGGLHFGITADPGLVPDPGAIAGAIPKALLDLQAGFDAAPPLTD